MNVWVIAAFGVNTVATLDRVIIKGTPTPTPTQELSVGATAEVIFATHSIITTQSETSSVVPLSMPLPLPDVSS